MKYTLFICLQAERVVTQLVRASRQQRILAFLRGFGGSAVPTGVVGDILASDVQLLANPESDLGPALERSMATVSQAVSAPVAGMVMEVRLGLAFARLGLLSLDHSGVSAAHLSAIAGGWIRERWHLDPASQALRWRRLGDGHVLVFCADRTVLEVVQGAAARNGLRLTSFLPAALPALLRKMRSQPGRGRPASRVLVWTEAGAEGSRAAPVHMFHIRDRALCADWRGWLPPSTPGDQGDPAMDGALARFLASHGASEAGVDFERWALPAPLGARAP